jgi:hypothetical protein
MRWYTKFVVSALAATALFASLAASASARNFSVTNRNIRVVWEALRPLELVSEFGTVKCRVTMEGSFHCATIAKVVEALIGYISRATADQEHCTDTSGNGILGEVRQETLPWHIRYVSFIGTLPRVTVRIRLREPGFRLLRVPVFGTCLYRAVSVDGIVSGPLGNEITEGNANVAAEEGREIRSETFGCPTGRFRSAPVPVLLLGTTTAIRVRLT